MSMIKDLKVNMKIKSFNKIYKTHTQKNPLIRSTKHKQWNEIKKTVQDIKVEIESIQKAQTEGKWR